MNEQEAREIVYSTPSDGVVSQRTFDAYASFIRDGILSGEVVREGKELITGGDRFDKHGNELDDPIPYLRLRVPLDGGELEDGKEEWEEWELA